MDTVYRVMVADSSDDDLLLIRSALKKFPNLQVVWQAKDGEEALAYLEGQGTFRDREKYPKPDIVVLELKMPVKDGFEVLERVGKRYGRPVLGVLSSSNDPKDERRATELGADLFQTKQFDDGSSDRFFHWLERIAEQKKRP